MMRPIPKILAAMTLSALASAADAQSMDSNGRCRDATGQLTKMEVCREKISPNGNLQHLYIRDNRGGCHDERGNPVNPNLCKR